jgi:Zn-dependent protease
MSEPFMFFEPAPTRFDLNFRLFGVWVRVHPMHWVVSVILGPSMKDGLAFVLAWVICVFLSILLHEMGHIMMGRIFGSDGHIVLYSFGGLAIPDRHLDKRWQRVLVFLAGPLIELIFAGILIVAGIAAVMLGYRPQENVATVFEYLMRINGFWAILNLLPIWPLDGGRISREFCTFFSPDRGVRASLLLSAAVSGFLAITAVTAYRHHPLFPFAENLGDLYLGLFFALFAVGSITALNQEATIRREWEDHWHQPDDDGDAWKR